MQWLISLPGYTIILLCLSFPLLDLQCTYVDCHDFVEMQHAQPHRAARLNGDCGLAGFSARTMSQPMRLPRHCPAAHAPLSKET